MPFLSSLGGAVAGEGAGAGYGAWEGAEEGAGGGAREGAGAGEWEGEVKAEGEGAGAREGSRSGKEEIYVKVLFCNVYLYFLTVHHKRISCSEQADIVSGIPGGWNIWTLHYSSSPFLLSPKSAQKLTYSSFVLFAMTTIQQLVSLPF